MIFLAASFMIPSVFIIIENLKQISHETVRTQTMSYFPIILLLTLHLFYRKLPIFRLKANF